MLHNYKLLIYKYSFETIFTKIIHYLYIYLLSIFICNVNKCVLYIICLLNYLVYKI